MAVGAEVVLAAPVVGHDVAGAGVRRADDLQPLLPCSALRTHVWTAAQPPPGILCPAFSSDHVMNEAHHGLPDGTFAAARYSSTFGPAFVPTSRTPSSPFATPSAAPPSSPAAAGRHHARALHHGGRRGHGRRRRGAAGEQALGL